MRPEAPTATRTLLANAPRRLKAELVADVESVETPVLEF